MLDQFERSSNAVKIIGFSHEDGVLHPAVTTVLQELMVGDISNGELEVSHIWDNSLQNGLGRS